MTDTAEPHPSSQARQPDRDDGDAATVELQPEAEWMSEEEVLSLRREGLPWGWEPVISTTCDGVYFMDVRGRCQWDVPTEEAWDEERIPPEIAETRWLKTLRRVRVRESADLDSRVIGSLPPAETVYVLEMTQVGTRNRRACIRCHMGWFSLSVVDPSKSKELHGRLDQASLSYTVSWARTEGIDEVHVRACESGTLHRFDLVRRILDLAADHQRASNPSAAWARIVQVEPCTTPMLLPGSELRVGSKFTPHSAAHAQVPSRLAQDSDAPRVPVPPQAQQRPPNRRNFCRPRTVLAKNEGLSASVYPYHVPAYGAFDQGFLDGLLHAHPRPPVQPEQVEEAVVAFEEQLMAMEFQRLDIEDEMRSRKPPSPRPNQAAVVLVDSSRQPSNEQDGGLHTKALLSEWEQSALAAAGVAPTNYFSAVPYPYCDNWQPSVRSEEKKRSRGTGDTHTAIPTLYRRAVPTRVQCTHPNSIRKRKDSTDDAPVAVRRAAPTAAQTRNRAQQPMGRLAGYASKRVSIITEIKQSDKPTAHAQSSRHRHVWVLAGHLKSQHPSKNTGELDGESAGRSLQLVPCAPHYTQYTVNTQPQRVVTKHVGPTRRIGRLSWLKQHKTPVTFLSRRNPHRSISSADFA